MNQLRPHEISRINAVQSKHVPSSDYLCPHCFGTAVMLRSVEPQLLNGRKVVVVKYECCNLECQRVFAKVEPVSDITAAFWDKHYRPEQRIMPCAVAIAAE